MPVEKKKPQKPPQYQAAVFGWPVKHSLSPRLHGYWLKKYEIDGVYGAVEVTPEMLEGELKSLPERKFSGVNLTVPHKETAMAHLQHIEPAAQRIGAVNTVVVREDGTLEGRNTDVYGFAHNLRSVGYRPEGHPVVVLGAGGAARAGVAALIDIGVPKIRIVNRTREHAEKLAADFGSAIEIHGWGDEAFLKEAELLVNATSLGLAGQPKLDLKLDELPATALVTDMVYNPLMTDLLQQAEARGNPVLDGLGMLLYQAKPAFAAFFGGTEPEVTEALRQVVLKPN